MHPKLQETIQEDTSYTCSSSVLDVTNSYPGIIISLSVLFAAGLAVYENPQVRQWVDSSRRKLAIALHNLGDEITPASASRDSSPDASAREDESPEAVERRRKARQEILERGRVMEEKRKSKKDEAANSKSFDDLVDKDGSLLNEKASVTTTATEIESSESGLRKRKAETTDSTLAASITTPFADEMHAELHDSAPSTPTVPVSPRPVSRSPNTLITLPIDIEAASNHPSEDLINLTPTTSTSSTFHFDMSLPSPQLENPRDNQWSVQEWAENNTRPGFYSPPQSEHAMLETEEPWKVNTPTTEGHLSRAGSEAGQDVWSEIGDRVSTPGSWTEVGSVVSEDYQ